jgi:putative DNA primase/helicase
MNDADRIRSALSFVPSDDRETWVMCAMAVKNEILDAGFDLWNEWSQSSEKYQPESAKAVWRSVRPDGGITVATLYKTAMKHGWRPDGKNRRATSQELAEIRQRAAQRAAEDAKERTAKATRAAAKAKWILSQCAMEKHAYLDSKGFPDMMGMVWRPTENENILCIPMRIDGDVVGVQLIGVDGGKKFLAGQRTLGAEHVIGPRGPAREVWVEGYATGQSVVACLAALKIPARVHVCFSAGNLERMSTGGFIVADRDESGTGEKAAIATGLPYFLPPDGDFNDLHRAVGTFRASQLLRKFLFDVK